MSEKQIISGDLLLFDGDPFAAPVDITRIRAS